VQFQLSVGGLQCINAYLGDECRAFNFVRSQCSHSLSKRRGTCVIIMEFLSRSQPTVISEKQKSKTSYHLLTVAASVSLSTTPSWFPLFLTRIQFFGWSVWLAWRDSLALSSIKVAHLVALIAPCAHWLSLWNTEAPRNTPGHSLGSRKVLSVCTVELLLRLLVVIRAHCLHLCNYSFLSACPLSWGTKMTQQWSQLQVQWPYSIAWKSSTGHQYLPSKSLMLQCIIGRVKGLDPMPNTWFLDSNTVVPF
jgi:hypothetical protein